MKLKVILGVILILIGIAVLGDQFTDSDIWSMIWRYWPVLIIYWGLDNFFSKKHNKYFSIVLTLLGMLFLVGNLGLTTLRWYDFIFPTLLIALGIRIILPSKWYQKKQEKVEKSYTDKIYVNEEAVKNGIHINNSRGEDYLDHYNIFSSYETNVLSKQFKGGELGSIFGGAQIDLREADLNDNKARIELYAIFGGVDLIVPRSWKVVLSGTPIFGGINNSTVSEASEGNEETRVLYVDAFAIFGGIEIKN